MNQGVQKLTINQLSETERADLNKAFGTARFVSDEDEATLWFLVPLFAGLAGVGVGIFHYNEFVELLTLVVEHPSMLPHVLTSLPVLAALAGFAVCGIAVWYFLRVHGRHGHAVTSFGVVQVRGPSLQVLRYEHIASISQYQFRVRRRLATKTTLTAKDGTRLTTYAAGLVGTISKRTRISVQYQ